MPTDTYTYYREPSTYGETGDEDAVIVPIAGLQYYSYCEEDDFYGDVRPKSLDRLQLIRAPENKHDANAIEVWFRNGQFKLGFIPAKISKFIAPKMDEGKPIRAYAISGGTGDSWSVEIALFGEALVKVPKYIREPVYL